MRAPWIGLSLLAAAVSALGSACDAGTRDDQKTEGPYVHLVDANVGPDKPLASNGVIRLRFDRYLLPITVSRQSFLVLDSTRTPLPAAIVGYDPVTATVTLSNPNVPSDAGAIPWLEVGQPYTLVLGVAEGTSDTTGVRALDRAPLDPASPVAIGFTVSTEVLPAGSVSEPRVTFCGDVLPVLSAKCASGSPCHGTNVPGAAPAAGLSLTTAEGVTRTAIARPAQGSSTGPRPGVARSVGRVFGIDMPIVDPGSPANSWLLYKVMMAPYPAATPTGAQDACPGPDGKVVRPTELTGPGKVPRTAEREALYDHIQGREMPYPPLTATSAYGNQPLTYEERQRFRLWIQQGAKVDACGACEPVVAPPISDAGTAPTGDGGVADAGP